MSLLWPDSVANIVTTHPRLHVFVIGVGDYLHLNGGAGKLAKDPLGLSQVSTPPVTAREITLWFLKSYKNLACELGSVELLLSPKSSVIRPDGTSVQIENATMQNIKDAFKLWVNRCSSNADNITLFYFCGHGLSKGSQYILPEDFGDPNLPNQWENCIDFDGLRVGMPSCSAQTQLFFIDACRETPFGTLTQVNVHGQVLITANVGDTVKCSATYYAATEGQQAFGPPNDITYFGQALMKCLNGVGSVNTQGKWVVDTYSLSNALGHVMDHLSRRHNLLLKCNTNVSGIAHMHEPKQPLVIASIGCTSPAANSVAEISLRRNAQLRHSAVGQIKPMIEEVEPGDWDIIVTFPGGQFISPAPLRYTFMPPLFEGVPVP